MKNIGTKSEVLEYEQEKIASFMKELLSIAKKYKIKGVFIGTRKQSQKFTDEDASVCAAFGWWILLDGLTKFEAKSLLESLDHNKKDIFWKIEEIANPQEEHFDHLDALAYMLAMIGQKIKDEEESNQAEKKKGRFSHTIEKIWRIFWK